MKKRKSIFHGTTPLKIAEEYHNQHHTDLNEAVYFMVFPQELTIYHYFKSLVDPKIYVDNIENIFKLFNCSRHG